jgi:hypothetical protein
MMTTRSGKHSACGYIALVAVAAILQSTLVTLA